MKTSALLIALLILFPVMGGQRTDAEEPAHYPTWSRDHVAVNLHFGSQTRMTDEQVKTAARLSNFICLEKAHGWRTDPDHPERIMGEDARRLRHANPDAKVLMYWNTLIAWPFTSYNQNFVVSHPTDWVLRDRETGEPLLKVMHGDRPVYQYNLLNSETRSWWANTSGGAVKEFGFDGLFVDAISQSKRPLWLRKGWGVDQADALDEAAVEMLQRARSVIGNDRLLIYNGFRTRAGEVDEETQGGARFLPYADGALIEHFDQLSSATKEDVVKYWQMAAKAAAEGKIVIYKAWPDHGANFSNEDFMKLDQAERKEIARSKITYPLACYLIGAEKHAYFCYGWGYGIDDGQLINYPQYQRRLGPPQGKANRVKDWVFTREYESASVTVDLENRTADIDWKIPL